MVLLTGRLLKELLRKMYQAGCYRVTFGIESGDPDTRKFIGKPHSLQQAKELIKYANKIGMDYDNEYNRFSVARIWILYCAPLNSLRPAVGISHVFSSDTSADFSCL